MFKNSCSKEVTVIFIHLRLGTEMRTNPSSTCTELHLFVHNYNMVLLYVLQYVRMVKKRDLPCPMCSKTKVVLVTATGLQTWTNKAS
jgi:hypothetical protein